VKADPGQIEQIIMNLAVNARDAMPHGGKLVITTTNTELDKNDIEKIPSVVRGHYVMLAVSDTGIGMNAQTQAHIFEPFFTTKEQGKGTGLGLATVYGIVKQSGGYIWVYSVPGQGTTFKIYLPRVDEPNEPFRPTEADARPLGGSETILLVEDEKEIGALAVRVLEARGYQVLETANPEDALQLSLRHNGPIHLLLTDVVMPGMSGRRVAEHLGPLRPNMKVLYMSGYTDDSVFRNGVLEVGAAFIQKPFTPSSLARKVREVLDEQKPA
jgi:CheY-like chemotaxis protein